MIKTHELLRHFQSIALQRDGFGSVAPPVNDFGKDSKRARKMNGLRARVWNMALAHADGDVDLEVGSDFWENSICYENRCKEGVKTVKVPAGTMQTLFKLTGQKVNTLIIDIEGAEQFIDFNQVPEEINKIIIELHPNVIGQEVTYNIVATLISLGFRVAREENDTFVFLRK